MNKNNIIITTIIYIYTCKYILYIIIIIIISIIIICPLDTLKDAFYILL